ncbi:MAG: ABC transporter permease [Bacteroidaceae bacterium]|nr:ABC transporter permease [Bacteroidaceae bacterium]MBQ9294030.1 ABC transporter permease [Bacteroidaceae bacterium]
MSKFILFLRHAIALVRADKLFSTIYVAGTAVAIASAMVVAIFVHIVVGDIAPESNRSRTLYLNNHFRKASMQEGEWHYYGFSTEAIDSCFRKMKCVEAVVGFTPGYRYTGNKVSDMERQREMPVTFIPTNPDFFRLYDFTFLSGRPFSGQEFQNGEPVCVITERLAKTLGLGLTPNPSPAGEGQNQQPTPLSHGRGAGGEALLLGGKAFRVVGVVKTVSYMMMTAAADVYFPYTEEALNLGLGRQSTYAYAGFLDVMILLRKGFSQQDFMRELEPLQRRYEAVASSQAGEEISWRVTANSQFFRFLNFFGRNSEGKESPSLMAMNLMPIALLMLLFLLLPAINLSGLVSNRMEARRAEMGIRKTFGAKRRWLLREVINENLVLTLIGGAVGWVLSWLFFRLTLHTREFLTLFQSEDIKSYEFSLDPAMFFTPTLFLVCFLCCAVLNLMAALIPAWRSLRKPIVESLNQKR